MSTALVHSNNGARDRLIALVTDSVSSPHTRRAYAAALRDFFTWLDTAPVPVFNKANVQAHRASLEARGLSSSACNVRLSALRRLASEALDNGLLLPEIAAGVQRVKGVRSQGVRMGLWLNARQAEQLILCPNPAKLRGARDRALLAVLIGCGLRRSELVSLQTSHVQQRDSRWLLCDVLGKHGRIRSIGMPAWAKVLLDRWLDAASISGGVIFRPVKGSRLNGDKISTQSVAMTLKRHAKRIGVPELACHDLRRTFARLSRQGGAQLEQLMLNLGHQSVETTQRYLNVEMDLSQCPCDFLGLSIDLAS